MDFLTQLGKEEKNTKELPVVFSLVYYILDGVFGEFATEIVRVQTARRWLFTDVCSKQIFWDRRGADLICNLGKMLAIYVSTNTPLENRKSEALLIGK